MTAGDKSTCVMPDDASVWFKGEPGSKSSLLARCRLAPTAAACWWHTCPSVTISTFGEGASLAPRQLLWLALGAAIAVGGTKAVHW